MKGLLKRDFLIMIKKIGKVKCILLLLAVLGMIIFVKDMAFIFLAVFLPVLCVAFPAVLLIEDEKCHWAKVATAFPVNKKQIVTSRYIFCIASCVVLSVSSMGIGLIYYIVKALDFSLMVIFNLTGVCFAVFYILILIPCNYALGSQAGSYVMVGMIGVVWLIGRCLPIDKIAVGNLPEYWPYLAVVGVVAILLVTGVLSWYVSLKVYDWKRN